MALRPIFSSNHHYPAHLNGRLVIGSSGLIPHSSFVNRAAIITKAIRCPCCVRPRRPASDLYDHVAGLSMCSPASVIRTRSPDKRMP